MQPTKENIKTEIRWHAVMCNSRMEIEIAERINSGGVIAHCPTYQKKYRTGRHTAVFFKTAKSPLFPSYIFVDADASFDKEKFETSVIRLMVFRRCVIRADQMDVINLTASDLTAAQARSASPLRIKRGDIMRVLHGAMAGKTAKALNEIRGELIDVEFADYPGRSVKVRVDSLARAV